jgi:hypothetical protein
VNGIDTGEVYEVHYYRIECVQHWAGMEFVGRLVAFWLFSTLLGLYFSVRAFMYVELSFIHSLW